jgi:hypothetical protein
MNTIVTTQLQIKTTIFATKEHYLAFRKSWKDYINSGKAKAWYDTDYYGCKRKRTKLHGSHFLLHCLLTDRDISKAFMEPQVNVEKRGFQDALHGLKTVGGWAKRIRDYDEGDLSKPSYMTTEKFNKANEELRVKLKEFLEPFGSGVTIKMLASVNSYLDTVTLTNLPDRNKEAA